MEAQEDNIRQAYLWFDTIVQGKGYIYTMAQVRVFSEDQATLTPLEMLLLERVEELEGREHE